MEVRAAVAKDFNIIGKFTAPFNATGTPTVTLPCGFTDDGRPVAFQLAGAHGAEAKLLRVAHAYQQITDWHTRRPPAL
jgi:amidase